MAILPDVLPPGLKLVVCGSAPGTRSARDGAYYAHPQNEFWPLLARGGVTPHRLSPQDYPLLPRYGVGLTDICKQAFGADSDLRPSDIDAAGLAARIAAAAPHLLVFNGKFSAKNFFGRQRVDYGLQPETIGATCIHVAPSTSKLARRYWNETIWMAAFRDAGYTPLDEQEADATG